MTNESHNWNEYEEGPLFQHFKRLDPTRPAIRASLSTPDAVDVHCYMGMWKGSSGDFELRLRQRAAEAAGTRRPIMLTEYLESGIGQDGLLGDIRKARKWLGPGADTGDEAALTRLAAQCVEFHAGRAMEQTEAARRLGYHAILPFGPGFWSDRASGALTPTAWAIRSALAPVGVSIDLFNQHFAAGSSPTAEVWVMNDTDGETAVSVTCTVSAEDPGFDASAAPPTALSTERFELTVAGHCVAKRSVTWPMPKREGRYFLAARLERPGAGPVLSRRSVYAVERRTPPDALRGRRLLIVETDAALSAWAKGLGATVLPVDAQSVSSADLVVVGPQAGGGEAFRALAQDLPRHVRSGGRVLVLEQFAWPSLPDPFRSLALERTDDEEGAPPGGAYGGTSRVFRWEEPQRAIWQGLPDEYLWRWNGRPGRVARVSMSSLPGRARVLVKYAEAERDDLKYVPVAAVPHGRGEVLYLMLDVAGRYRAEDPDFDPVVERLMMNLLTWR